MAFQISNRAASLSESSIRKLVPLAEQAKQRSIEVIHLNIGQPDIETPDSALAAVKNYEEKVIAYSHSLGNISLREKLSSYYKSVAIDLKPQQIMVTTGGSEAIFFALSVLTDFGDQVITPEPFYVNYQGIAKALGVQVKTIPSSIEESFSLPGIEAFKHAINNKTKAIIVCNPNNPTGYLYTREEIEQLVTLAKENQVFLLFDEVYREFVYEGEHTSIFHMEGVSDLAILIDSFSKRYSMCGARVGSVATKNKAVFDAMVKLAQARLSPPTWSQLAAEAALDTPVDYFNKVKETYKKRRDILVSGLQNIPGVICPNPGGAFYCMISLPVSDTDHFAAWLLTSFSYKGKTLMVAPGSGFYTDPQKGKNQVRIAYVLEENYLEQAVEILKEALVVYKEAF